MIDAPFAFRFRVRLEKWVMEILKLIQREEFVKHIGRYYTCITHGLELSETVSPIFYPGSADCVYLALVLGFSFFDGRICERAK